LRLYACIDGCEIALELLALSVRFGSGSGGFSVERRVSVQLDEHSPFAALDLLDDTAVALDESHERCVALE